MRIYTHFNVDLDAACSVWAAQKFVAGMDTAGVVFVPANWQGPLADGDIAVDIEAGGEGWKGLKDPDGTVHSCFSLILQGWAGKENREALSCLEQFVDAQDAHGSAVKWLTGTDNEVLSRTGLNAVLRALQARHPRNDALVVERMSEILDGMLLAGRSRIRAEKEADLANVYGQVAVVVNSKEFATNGILFERGMRFVVYVDGNNLGVIREGTETVRTDHPTIRAVVEAAGELDEWFAHPAGFLFCRGSRKAPAETRSKVGILALVHAVSKM